MALQITSAIILLILAILTWFKDYNKAPTLEKIVSIKSFRTTRKKILKATTIVFLIVAATMQIISVIIQKREDAVKIDKERQYNNQVIDSFKTVINKAKITLERVDVVFD